MLKEFTTKSINRIFMNIGKLLSVLSLGLLVSTAAIAQEEKPKKEKETQDMKAMCEQMQKKMAAMDEKMDKLVTDMNAALTPDKKLDAVVAILNEMALERKAMHEQMDACSQMWDQCPGMMSGGMHPGGMMKHHTESKATPTPGSQ